MICYQVSAKMMNRKQTFCILGLLYFLWQINMSMCSNPQIIGGPLPPNFNATLAELERGYVKWVSFVGSLRHSVYVSARNQLAPCNVLLVDKTRRYGTYFRVQDAVDAIPLFNFQRVVIYIRAGTYREKVMVPALKPFITFQGEGMDKTIITWDDTANKLGSDGKPIGTFNTATVAIDSAYFIARNITFQNSAPAPPPGAVGRQAVALRISGDTAAFYGCHFLGAQDTLYDHFGRHYFKDCYIEGSVDFVFGNALSLYEQCHLHAISQNVYGALTAQRRSNLLDDTGFSFVNCKVTGSGALYLGRAWGSFSRVVFAYTYMDPVVIPKGWYDWGDPSREQTVFYGEYRCYGPGANYQGRVAWARDLKYEEVKPFLQISLIDGPEWLDS